MLRRNYEICKQLFQFLSIPLLLLAGSILCSSQCNTIKYLRIVTSSLVTWETRVTLMALGGNFGMLLFWTLSYFCSSRLCSRKIFLTYVHIYIYIFFITPMYLFKLESACKTLKQTKNEEPGFELILLVKRNDLNSIITENYMGQWLMDFRNINT